MLPDRVSNPGPLTYESGALMIALRGPVFFSDISTELNVEGKRYEKREYRYLIRKYNQPFQQIKHVVKNTFLTELLKICFNNK